MENSTSKAIMIGVGIFVTVAITSGILFSINQMKDIYSKVYETDTSITSRFSEYDAFDGTTVTGVDVINAISKYKDLVSVNTSIPVRTEYINDKKFEEAINDFYTYKFSSELVINQEKVTGIKFTKK